MAWNEAVITDSGIALLAKTFTEGNIVFTRAVGGEDYTEGSRLMQQTAVEPPAHELGLAGIAREKGKITVKVRGQNTGLESRYTLRQIGVFAKEKDAGGEVLFAIIQDETGEIIPAITENPEFLIELDFVIPISNAEKIEVNISSNLYALLEDVEGLLIRRDIVISRENWNVDKDKATLYTDVPLKEITPDMTPILTVLPDDLPAAKSCGMSTVCQTLEGRLRVFAQKNPAADIHGSLLLVREYGGVI